jgi:two-component system LytT family response regulator
MRQINVVIIDDEPIAIEVIKELVNHLTTDLSVVGTATNGVDAVQKIKSLQPDLIFMDVDMPLMNGIEVLEKFPNRHFELIFTTGFESQALKKVVHKAVAFLLKPIDPAEFVAAVEKARKKIGLERA